jgi:hypothetical protein
MPTTHSSQADDEYSDDEDIDYTFWYKTYTSVDGTVLDVLIKKDYDELTKDDVLKHWTKVEASMFEELNSFILLAAIKIGRKGETGNVMTSRWVLKFKKKDDQRVIKARLCVHGFKDKDSETLSTFASTATKWTQRLVTATAAQQGWLICSADVSSAFIRGLTFEQMSKLTGHEVRTAAFSVPKNTIDIVRRLEGFSHYDPDVHEIVMCKPIYGLKDAPRAWRQRLHLALCELQGRSLATDSSLYVWHRVVPPLVAPSLVLMCSTHVDDLKITGTPSDIEFLLGGLAKMFGNLTIHRGTFTYCGIEHEQQKDFSVVTHQSPYAANLMPISTTDIDLSKPDVALTAAQHTSYLSLLGALAWLGQTRLDTCIFCQALQRAASRPTVGHLVRLNSVVRWAKRKEVTLVYKRIDTTRGPVRLCIVADAAFRREDLTGLAMRGHLVFLASAAADSHCLLQGADAAPETVQIQILNWCAKRQKRVVRSTFAAELNSAADALEDGKLLALAITEIAEPSLSALHLQSRLVSGTLAVKLHLFTDCRSIFDALKLEDLRVPSEASLFALLLIIKQLMTCGLLSRLYWVDTRDMLADGLNKGAISRVALMHSSKAACWSLQHTAKWCRHEATLPQIMPAD